MQSISVTLWTAQPPMSWLKAEAWRKLPRNMPSILVTPEVSHAPMFSLKDDALLNNSDMSVTPRVPHSEICPYVSSAEARSESHAATAVRMLVSSRGTVGTGVTLGAAVVGSGVGFVGMAEVGIGVGVYEGVAVVGTADVVGSDDGRDDGMGDGKEVVG